MRKILVLIAALAMALTACGAGSDHNAQDVAFASDMIPHHLQAVDMAAMALDPARGASDDVAGLATAIRGAQGPEIQTMSGWLAAWGEDVPTGDAMAGHAGMAGMMSSGDMAALGAAEGADFDAMWLRMMTEHHSGAIEMATVEQGDGQYDDAVGLAGDIITAQRTEIDRMRRLLSA